MYFFGGENISFDASLVIYIYKGKVHAATGLDRAKGFRGG